MFHATTRVEFDSAHRLLNYPGACKRLHGHRYTIEATVGGQHLDQLGMLLDFGILKREMKELAVLWDHLTILHPNDQLVKQLEEGETCVMRTGNPTAENMAKDFFDLLITKIPRNITLERVRVYETPDCYVEYELP